ncbi:hypothetical protein, partial [Klenkia sp. PcliD-1-E]|uniref:hypothetical protein n=1 Tax=Klenkia sp. PcliD-1-E TaxID=2954492 RepID=UPI002096F0E5
ACVPPATPLAELLAPAARSGRPVVVVDEAHRPVGVLPLTALLAALAPDGPRPDPVAPAPREVAGV